MLQKIIGTLHRRNYYILDSPENYEYLGGNLNYVFKLKDENGKKYVLKIPKAQNRYLIRNYLFQLYQAAGFVVKGNEFFYRTLIQQRKFSQLCKKKSILVPEVLSIGKNFIFTQFLNGEIYKDIVKHDCKAISIVFKELINAHKNGVVFGDRWGGNELLVGNRVCFFDFDIGYLREDESQFQKCKDFELAVITYRTILYSSRKNTSLRILEQILENNKSEYNLKRINNYLVGFTKFYCNQKKLIIPFSEPVSVYENTNQYVTKMIQKFED